MLFLFDIMFITNGGPQKCASSFLFLKGVILWISVNMHFSQMLLTQEISQKVENVWDIRSPVSVIS